MADRAPSIPLERWLTLGGSIIAPATAISSLLFYFGYVSSRAQFEYFGLDVDTIGLTTQGFIMRSPQPLLVPLLVLCVLGAGAVLVHAAIRRGLESAFAQPAPEPAVRARSWIGWVRAGGLLLLSAGVILLFLYPLMSDWTPFNLLTPVVIVLGGSIAAYTFDASKFVVKLESAADLRQESRASLTGVPAMRPKVSSSVWLRPAVGVFILVAVAASTLWATATIAQWSGVGLAQRQALHLSDLPSVILDTKERLFLTSPGIKEVALPPSVGQTFRYRYRNLRLLIQGDNRVFLVPDRWSASNSTLLVRLDNSVRLQFQFINQVP